MENQNENTQEQAPETLQQGDTTVPETPRAEQPTETAGTGSPGAAEPTVKVEEAIEVKSTPTSELVGKIQAATNSKSGSVTKVAHKDYVLMLRDGLVDNETKKLITGEQLEIDPEMEQGTFKVVADQGEGAE